MPDVAGQIAQMRHHLVPVLAFVENLVDNGWVALVKAAGSKRYKANKCDRTIHGPSEGDTEKGAGMFRPAPSLYSSLWRKRDAYMVDFHVPRVCERRPGSAV